MALQAEITELEKELTRIATTTTFNGEIYPLYGGGGGGFPDAIQETEITIVNNSSGIVTCDGVTYQPGESFTKNVLSVMKGSDYTSLAMAAIMYMRTSGNGAGYTSSTIFVIGSGISEDSIVGYQTLSDLKIDDNGYYYADPLFGNERYYLNPQGFSNYNPPSADNLEANGVFKATAGDSEPIQIQAGSLAGQSIEIPLVDASASKLGVSSLDISSFDSAGDAINKIASAIETVSSYRSQFGALQNRLEHAKANIDNTAENTQNAESRIRDTDMAEEMVGFSAASIVAEVSQSMLSQANSQPQQVLSLLE